MTKIPEMEELEALHRQTAGVIARLKDHYVREDRRMFEIPNFGWVVIGPGDHVRKAAPHEIKASAPTVSNASATVMDTFTGPVGNTSATVMDTFTGPVGNTSATVADIPPSYAKAADNLPKELHGTLTIKGITVETRPRVSYLLLPLTASEKARLVGLLGGLSNKAKIVRNAFAIASVRAIGGEPVPFPATYEALRTLEFEIGNDLPSIRKALEGKQ